MAGSDGGQTGSKSKTLDGFVYILAAIAGLFLFRVFVGEGGAIANVDERELMASVLDRVGGIPSTSLAWPAATVQMVLLPFAVAQSVVAGGSPGVAGLLKGMASLYSSPTDWTLVARLVLVGVSALLAWVGWRKAKQQGSTDGALIGMGALFLSPVFVYQSFLVSGDGIGVWATVAAILYALYEPRPNRALAVAGILLGFAIGSRVGFAMYLPLIAGLIWQRREKEFPAGKLVLAFGFGLLIGVLLFMPYIWTDPIRLLKSVAGNAGRGSGGGGSFGAHLITGIVQSGIALWLVAGAALFLSEGKFRKTGLILAGYSVLVLLFVSKLGVINDRYFMLVLPGVAVAAAYAAQGWKREFVATKAFQVCASVAVLAFVAVGAFFQHGKSVDKAEVAGSIEQLSAGHQIYVSRDIFYKLDYRKFDEESLKAMRGNAMQAVALGMDASGEPQVMQGLPWVFKEDEQAFIGRVSTVLSAQTDGEWRVVLAGFGMEADERIGAPVFDPLAAPVGSLVVVQTELEMPRLHLEKRMQYEGSPVIIYSIQE